jgi:uncharacterized membrane protein YgdD (TMEM256/DUF423 family)
LPGRAARFAIVPPIAIFGDIMSAQARLFIVLGALSALASVIIGAATTHTSNENVTAGWAQLQTALQYHQFHALALLAVGLTLDRMPSRWIAAAGWLMVLGTLLFSGNLYLRSIAGYHDLHAVTPFGGGAFMLGWLALAIGVAHAGQKNGRPQAPRE